MHKTRKNNNPKYNIPIQLSHNNSISPGKSTSRSQWKGEGCAQVDVSGIGNGNGNGRVKDKGKGKGKDKGRGGYEGKEKYGDKQNRDDIKQYKDNTNKIPTSIPTAPSRTQCHSPALTSLNPNIEINNTNTYNKNNKVTNNNNQLQSLAITNKKDRQNQQIFYEQEQQQQQQSMEKQQEDNKNNKNKEKQLQIQRNFKMMYSQIKMIKEKCQVIQLEKRQLEGKYFKLKNKYKWVKMMYKGKAQKGMEDVEDDGDNQGQLSGSGTGSNTYRQKQSEISQTSSKIHPKSTKQNQRQKSKQPHPNSNPKSSHPHPHNQSQILITQLQQTLSSKTKTIQKLTQQVYRCEQNSQNILKFVNRLEQKVQQLTMENNLLKGIVREKQGYARDGGGGGSDGFISYDSVQTFNIPNNKDCPNNANPNIQTPTLLPKTNHSNQQQPSQNNKPKNPSNHYIHTNTNKDIKRVSIWDRQIDLDQNYNEDMARDPMYKSKNKDNSRVDDDCYNGQGQIGHKHSRYSRTARIKSIDNNSSNINTHTNIHNNNNTTQTNIYSNNNNKINHQQQLTQIYNNTFLQHYKQIKQKQMHRLRQEYYSRQGRYQYRDTGMGMGRGIGRDRGEELQRIQPILYDEHEHEYQYQNNRQGYADGVCNSNNGDHNITDVYKNSSGRSAVVIASHPALSPNKKQSQPQDNNYKHNNLNNTHTHMYMQQRQTHNNARNLIHNQHMAYEKPREQYHAEIRDIRDRYLSVWEGDRQERQDRQEKQKYQMEYDRIIENYQARSSGPQTDGYRDRQNNSTIYSNPMTVTNTDTTPDVPTPINTNTNNHSSTTSKKQNQQTRLIPKYTYTYNYPYTYTQPVQTHANPYTHAQQQANMDRNLQKMRQI